MNDSLGFFKESLMDLREQGRRMTDAMEKMAAHSATIEAHTLQLKHHDSAFIAVFDRLRDFERKQDSDFRNNLDKINTLADRQGELALKQGIHIVVEEIGNKAEVKKELEQAESKKYWNSIKLALIHPLIGAIGFGFTLFTFCVVMAEKFGLFKMWKDFVK
jgi:hypothetical protein